MSGFPVCCDQVSVDEQFGAAWSEAVDAWGAILWGHVRARSSSAREAAEVFQLVWLRLELETRSDGLPADLLAWLLRQVTLECERATDLQTATEVPLAPVQLPAVACYEA
jgi:hypothetical protein